MDIRQKTNLISLLVLVVCLIVGVVIYLHTGTIFIAIIFAPPIFHWILRKRTKD